MEDNGIKIVLNSLIAGINRFINEGYLRWSKHNLQCELKPRGYSLELSNSMVQNKLREWEAKGYIKIIGRDDCYIEVLKPIPEENNDQ